MQDVMYGRFENFPPQFLRHASDGQEEEENVDDDDDEDETLVDVCCSSTLDSHDGKPDASSDDGSRPLRQGGGRRRCSPLLKIGIAITISILIFLFAYNLLSSTPPNPFEQQSSAPLINSSRANALLSSVCTAVSDGRLAGDICGWLCHRSRNYTITGFYRGGSKTVLKLNLGGKDLILKTQHISIDDYDAIDTRVDAEEFTDKVLNIVNEQLRMDWPARYKNHLLRMLWPAHRTDQRWTDAARQSLWALMQQDEFVEMRVLPQTRVTPKVLGTCGHLYQVEYLIPFKMKAYYVNLKAKILVHLMGTLKLFYEFLNEPLQWCDVKFENLGLSAEYPRRFMVMDSDMLYTSSRLGQILTAQPCTNNTECNYFDCHSSCNNTTGFCSPRTNDNVDVFCEKLINRLFGTFWSKANKYLSACHDKTVSPAQRLTNLQYIWAWSFVNV